MTWRLDSSFADRVLCQKSPESAILRAKGATIPVLDDGREIKVGSTGLFVDGEFVSCFEKTLFRHLCYFAYD
jgi:hypothetical protein